MNVTGTTSTTGAISVTPLLTKTVCVLGVKSGTPTTLPLAIADISGTAAAIEFFGSGAKAVDMVDILVRNGVSKIKGILVPNVGAPYTTIADAYEAALDKSMLYDLDIIIMDTIDSTVLTVLKSHLDLAESEDKFRYSVIGKSGTQAELATLAQNTNHSRIFVGGPNLYNKNMGDADQTMIAAGIASVIALTTDPATPNDGVELLGFGGCKSTLLKSEKDALATAGVVALYQSPSGNPTIHQLVTSYTKNAQAQADPIWHDGTTRLIADHVLKSNQDLIRSNYKRSKNVTRILNSMRTTILVNMEKLQVLEIIENFDPATLAVRKDPSDAFGAIIEYTFDVVTPLYNVTIVQNMKL